MLISNEGDNDVFFDTLDCLSPTQESLLIEQELGYEIWVNEPLSVKERRERFLQGMGLVDASSSCSSSFSSSSEVYSQEEMRVRDCSGAVSNACIVPDEQVSEKLVLSGREVTSEALGLLDEHERDDNLDANYEGKVYGVSCSDQELRHREAEALEEFRNFDMGKTGKKSWWKHFMNSRKKSGKAGTKLNSGTDKTQRVMVRRNKKKWMEFSALYVGQEIRAHKGLIWTMKFSPNGQYLASGGEDGVIRIWRVSSLSTSSLCFSAEDNAVGKVKQEAYSSKKYSSQSFVALPKKIFKIEESPIQEFYGHSGDVLDLAWSNSDTLLSSSMDKTVRLWKIRCDQCQGVFHHKDYVTCIQFNPIDENCFISGSIDGKVRIWGIKEERVVDWADIRDVISAISYQPDGKGFVVGSLTGTCRFYVASGKHFQLEAQIHVNGKKRTSANKITGIQFSQKNHQRIMITSEDSKVRILEGNELVQTCKGLPKSGSQTSASFTSGGKHIISVGDDSRVYVWNFNDLGSASSKQTKSKHSCEYFCSEGVTVAIPWSGTCADSARCSSETQHQIEATHMVRESESFSFGSWFSIDGTWRGSMTWPEEKLPGWDLPLAEAHQQPCVQDPCHDKCVVSETWGVSIVAAGCDGTIKTFHNFGLPIRL